MANTLRGGEERRAIFWHAMAKIGGKRGLRNLLPDGPSAFPFSATIDWRVGRASDVHDSISGRVLIADDQQKASSSAPDFQRLLALALERMSEANRVRFIRDIRDRHARGEGLGDCSADTVALCKQLLMELRSHKTVTQAGIVRVEVDDD